MKVLLIFLFLSNFSHAWNPFKNICIRDCCGEFAFNQTALIENLKDKLHGQPLVQATLPHALNSHLSTTHPTKALVLSLHGWTGSGKNYASQIMAESIFKSGLKSSSVKFFMSSIDFMSASKVEEYKESLKEIIRLQLKRCSRALFIFDEMDKMPIGLLDSINPFLEHFHEVVGVDPRKSIFLFLSNTAGKAINEIVYNDWLTNKPRDAISLSAVQSELSKSAFNEVKGGLWHSYLIQSNVITSFIPFFPLERKHVILCIWDEFRRRGMEGEGSEVGEEDMEEVVAGIADEIEYWPESTQIFSLSGCKRIPQLVNMHVYAINTRRRTEL